MSTPILTKKQQRQSLSAKKKSSRNLRTILAQSPESYWPVVNVDQCQSLITLMNKLLPSIKRAMFKIPGSTLRHMTKDKRALVRKEALENETIKPDENMLKSVIIGINAVTRALERNKVCCILLDANVEPPLLIKHIVSMAQNKQVPILLLPTLKTITLQTIGFATAAFALKDNVMQSNDNAFHILYQSVTEIFQNFLPPKFSRIQLFRPDKASEENICEMEIRNPVTNISKKSVFMDIYLYRSSEDRVFRPDISDSQVSQASSDITISNDNLINDGQLISLSMNDEYINTHKEKDGNTKKIAACDNESILMDSDIDPWEHQEDRHIGNHTSEKRKSDDIEYLSLKIKRVKGNDNRIKATKFAKKKK